MLPKIEGDFKDKKQKGMTELAGRALYEQFVAPTVNDFSTRIKETFNPRNIMNNLVTASPILMGAKTFSNIYGELSDKDKKRDPTGKDGSLSDAQVKSSFASLSNEIKDVAFNISNYMAESNKTFGMIASRLIAIEKVLTKVEVSGTEDVKLQKEANKSLEIIKNNQTTPGAAKEKLLETDNDFNILGPETLDNIKEKQKSTWGMVAAGLIASLTGFKDQIIAATRVWFSSVGKFISSMFKDGTSKLAAVIKESKIFQTITKTVQTFLKPLELIFGPLLKEAGLIARIGGRVASFAKAIPVIGEIVMAISALIDFGKGFAGTKGNLLKKMAGGLDGVIQGLLKAIVEVIKLPLLGIKKLAEVTLKGLGFEEAAKKLKDFSLGKLFDDFSKNIIEKFTPNQSIMDTIIKTVLDTFKFVMEKVFKINIDTSGVEKSFGIDPNKKNVGERAASITDDIASAATRLVKTQNTFGKNVEGNAKQAYDFFIKKGYSKEQAAGIVAGMHAESKLDPNAVNPDSKAHGIGQWLGSRRTDFKNKFGKDITKSTFQEQLEFMEWELNNTEKKAGDKIKKASKAGEALDSYITKFMRPAKGLETSGDLRRGAAFIGSHKFEDSNEPEVKYKPGYGGHAKIPVKATPTVDNNVKTISNSRQTSEKSQPSNNITNINNNNVKNVSAGNRSDTSTKYNRKDLDYSTAGPRV